MLKYREDTDRVQPAWGAGEPLRRCGDRSRATSSTRVLGFARTLRHAGVRRLPGPGGGDARARSAHLDVLDPADVYWAGRLTLCGGPDDLDRYDAAFAA